MSLKRIYIFLLLVAAMLLSLCACTVSSAHHEEPEPPTQQDTKLPEPDRPPDEWYLPASLSMPEITLRQLVIQPVILPPKPLDPIDFKPRGNVLILCYHTFTEDGLPPEGEMKKMYTTDEKFHTDVQALLDAGWKSISLERFYCGDYDASEKYFAITFDDGYRTNYTHAFPIIRDMRVYADIFYNTAHFDDPNLFDMAMAAEMEESGLIKIYSHMPRHDRATEMSMEDFKAKISESFDTLFEATGNNRRRFLAYPFSDYNKDTYEAAKEAGVELQFVQYRALRGKDLCLRVSVAYDTDMLRVIKRGARN